MDATQGKAFLRANGATDAHMASLQHKADQAIACADELCGLAYLARRSDDPFEVVALSEKMIGIVMATGAAASPVVNAIQVLALRCADAAIEIQELVKELAEARGEQE